MEKEKIYIKEENNTKGTLAKTTKLINFIKQNAIMFIYGFFVL